MTFAVQRGGNIFEIIFCDVICRNEAAAVILQNFLNEFEHFVGAVFSQVNHQAVFDNANFAAESVSRAEHSVPVFNQNFVIENIFLKFFTG